MFNINVHSSFSGHFALAAVNKKTGEVKSVGYIKDPGFIEAVTKPEADKPFDNLLTDGFLNYVGTKGTVQGSDWWIHVGTGTTAPANSDNSLVTQVAKSNTFLSNSDGYSGAPDHYNYRIAGRTFAIGTFSGQNLSEIGVSDTGSDTGLISRALILDSGGSPTTLTVTADDELRAYWELRKYPPLVDGTGSFTETNLSTVHNYTVRAAEVHSNNNWNPTSLFGSNVDALQVGDDTNNLVAIDANVNVNPLVDSANGVASSYTADSHERTYTFDFSTGQGNVGGTGISYIFWEGAGVAFQIKLDATEEIDKDNTKIITGFNITCSWGRKV